MARVPFRLPDIGEGIAEAEIVTWHVKIGDMVEEDQPVADMMTDKATVEMAAPVSGKVIELAGAVGDQIAIGSTLIVFETEGGEAAAPVVVPAAEKQASPLPEREGSHGAQGAGLSGRPPARQGTGRRSRRRASVRRRSGEAFRP